MNHQLSRRHFLGLAGAVGLATGCSNPAPFERPNVIIILTDDQGYGDISFHGNPILDTPSIDRLASESIRLTDFHVAPVCTPTRSQLLTGRDACRNGGFAWAYSREIPHRRYPMMPEIFAANGYRTGHFGKWHLGDNYPFRPQDRGFQETIHHRGAGITQSPDYWNNDYFDDHYSHNGETKQYEGYCTDVWFSEAMRFMRESQQAGEPFFVYLPTNAPHGPYYTEDRYRQPYLDLLGRHTGPRVAEFADRYNNRATASFFGMVANLDENMARLESMLADTGLRENTILIWMTDNGATAGAPIHNSGMRGRKGSLYDGGHRVPCFLRWPAGGLRPPGAVETLTEIQDLLPTLTDLCQLDTPAGVEFDGTNLASTLRGDPPDTADRMLVVQHATAPEAEKWRSAVLWGRWRLVAGEELYDIGRDPTQESDIAAKHPEIVRKLRDHYEQWWASAQASLNEIPHFVVGHPQANPVRLCCFDWPGYTGEGNVTVQPTIRAGAPVNGYWNIEVATAGDYEIALRRWPEEADTPIRSATPEYQAADAVFPPGKALPIVRARLRVGEQEEDKPVAENDKAAVFEMRLDAGRMRLKTWFYDAAGTELCGAYYTTVRKL